jgi:tetratricopeptide (TPR) repeat protein
MRRRLGTMLLWSTGALGCLHGAPAAPAPVLLLDPVEIVGRVDIDQVLAGMNDEELFAQGESRYAAGDFAVAAKAFGRLVDVFPKSAHLGAASYNAGLALEQLEKWSEARARYEPLLDLEHGTGDQIDAGFRAAECEYHLGRYAQAVDLLQRIRARGDLSANLRLEATDQVGICQLEAGQRTEAETTLRQAVYTFENADLKERLDDYYPSQAQFYLGEIYRLYFEEVPLDPNQLGGTDKLSKDLEYKAEMLLSAQGHYLRAIRMANSTWATAAGTRVGGLYEAMYDAMMDSPPPADLDAEQQQVYREELHKKIRVLVTKAISIYESTLEAAERTGTNGPFIEEARQRLERMKSELLADAKGESPPVVPKADSKDDPPSPLAPRGAPHPPSG